jgi:hypothetical protein
MPRWHVLVEGTCRQIDTVEVDRFRAALLPQDGRLAYEGTRIIMAIIIEAQESHAAAKRALELWWEYAPSNRFLTLLIWQVEDTPDTGLDESWILSR